MRNESKSYTVVGGLIFLIALVVAAHGQKTASVIVTNTTSNPVPVTGDVSITNTPAVDARQSGDWNVGINGTPTVRVDPTTPLTVTSADEPAKQWISFNLITNERIFTPPSGKTLVIEYVSGTITLGNTFGAPILQCSSTGIVLPKMSRPVDSANTTWYFSELVRGYADSDNNVVCTTNFATVGGFIFIFKGHLINGVRNQQ